jgi:hypothetical protein
MAALHKGLQAFLASSSTEFEAVATTEGDPSPYETLLPGLRVRKAQGPVILGRAPSGWLVLEGSRENLERYTSYFHFPQGSEDGHHHPENCNVPGYMSASSLNLVIEVDSRLEGESAA